MLIIYFLYCLLGKYRISFNLGGSTNCLDCEVGYYNKNTGQSSCTACALGTFQSQSASSSCVNCGVGKFSTISARTADCDECSAGYI